LVTYSLGSATHIRDSKLKGDNKVKIGTQ